MEKYIPYLAGLIWVFSFFACLIGLSKLVRPKVTREKTVTKPSMRGVSIGGRFKSLLVISCLFTLAILILFPAITDFRRWVDQGRGIVVLSEIGLFITTISVAFAYVWKKGDLDWES